MFARGRSRSGLAGRREPHERAAGRGGRINVSVRTVAAAAVTAGTAGEVVGGGEHEQAGVGVEVAGLTRLDGGAVPGEDLRTAGMVERQAARMGFAVVSRHLVRTA